MVQDFRLQKSFHKTRPSIENIDFMFTLGAVSGISTDQF